MTSGESIVHAGPLPPLHVRLVSRPTRLPGVDLDVYWHLSTGPMGPGLWRQRFRDGLEVSGGAAGNHVGLELEMKYSEMLMICYGGASLDSVLSPEEVLPLIAPLSCLTGLLHGRRSIRSGLLAEPVLHAIARWSDSVGGG